MSDLRRKFAVVFAFFYGFWVECGYCGGRPGGCKKILPRAEMLPGAGLQAEIRVMLLSPGAGF